jgi:hypothetical protein
VRNGASETDTALGPLHPVRVGRQPSLIKVIESKLSNQSDPIDLI